MMPYPCRGQKSSGQAGLRAASHLSVIPTLQDTNRGQRGVPWGKHGRQQAGQVLPHPRPTGWGRHCPWSSQHLFCSKSTSTQDHRGVGMRTQRSCCPAPGTEDSEGKLVSPPDRGCLCCTGLLLFSAMTLARSWDWGPADFTSCRFCSRIYVEREGERSSVCSQAGEFGRGIPRAYWCPVSSGVGSKQVLQLCGSPCPLFLTQPVHSDTVSLSVSAG